VFVTQTLDANHPVLAQTLDLVAALAARFEEIVVICASAPRHRLPSNVRIRVYGAPGRLVRGMRFVGALSAELHRRPAPVGVFAHMVPLFVLLASPLAKPRKIRLLLWYTHGKSSRSLRLATRLADVVLSADRRSFPLPSAKVRGIGHAIDVEVFSPSPRNPRTSGDLRLLALGRYSYVKGYPDLLEGFRKAVERGLDASLELRGPQLTDAERLHRADLERFVSATPSLRDRVTFAEAVPRERVPELLRNVDGLVNATIARNSETFDKVVCEAAACGVPVLVSNPILDDLVSGLAVELRFDPSSPEDLAEKLLAFSEAGREKRTEIGAELRRRVVAGHSVESWADAVAAAVSGSTPE
jgi:glycosyltransferase involved in cell wall biosynthesis